MVWFNYSPNIVSFQLVTGDEQFYIVGTYIPPNCMRGVDNLRRAGDACSAGGKLVVLGYLNVNVGFPRDEWEETIVDLLDDFNLIDRSCVF